MDASGTIDDSQWKRTKDFVRGVSSAFNVADNGTRTAVSSMMVLDATSFFYGTIFLVNAVLSYS